MWSEKIESHDSVKMKGKWNGFYELEWMDMLSLTSDYKCHCHIPVNEKMSLDGQGPFKGLPSKIEFVDRYC